MTAAPSLGAGLPDRVRLPLRLDPAALAVDLAALEGEPWIRHFVPQNYEGEWSVLPLRAPAGETYPSRLIHALPDVTEFVDTPFLARAPHFRQALGLFGCPLRLVRLMRLAAGSAIKPHEDNGLDLESGFARIHIPIRTGPEVAFLLNDRPVPMTPGSAWYLRLSDPHSVDNRGASDRVHLVVDCVVNDWLMETLRAAADPSAE